MSNTKCSPEIKQVRDSLLNHHEECVPAGQAMAGPVLIESSKCVDTHAQMH